MIRHALCGALQRLPLVGTLVQFRFVRFGAVGFSGTLVNLGILYAGQELLFSAIADPVTRLNLSLGTAICCATVNNFFWNRLWTWSDRLALLHKGLTVQFGQYVVASWFSILLQFLLTRALAVYVHYLLANVSAIVLAAVVGYIVNDIWTFGTGHRGRG